MTPGGIEALHERLTRGRQRLHRHEQLCRATAEWQVANGRLAFLRTSFRAKVGESWRMARPDVICIRRTTREDLLAPVVYEIKVSRADLLGDIGRPDKRLAYRQLARELYYVVAAGIAAPADVPDECGLVEWTGATFRTLRVAPKLPCEWSFGNWMALLMSERIAPAADGVPQPDLVLGG